MAEENKTPVVIRTQVYLNDPDYFCNKSWTMSFNMNTKSWISFHSYIPNFYIGENNFFYSGLNGCCDIDGVGFQAIAGVLSGKAETTSTTTTYYPSPTTTTTTTVLDCTLRGVATLTNCVFEGTAIVTVPPTTTTTTTICYIPSDLSQLTLAKGYTLGTSPEVIFTNSYQEACDAIPAVSYVKSAGNTDGSTLESYVVLANINASNILNVEDVVYYGEGPYCNPIPDGWYIPLAPVPLSVVYNIVGNIVVAVLYCECSTTTTTTTAVPNVPECCGILVSSNDTISYLDQLASATLSLDVPGYTSSLGIAMTANYLWSYDTLIINRWDITLSPFSATSSGTINFPMGYTPGYGMVAKNDAILISTDTSVSPNTVNELDVTGGTAVATTIFSLQANRTSVGNMLYTTDGKLITLNQDGITSDYYITQYEYSTGLVEIDLNIGSVEATSIYECNCDIYVVDAFGNLYVVIKIYPYVLLNLGINVQLSPINSATQIASCVVTSITEITTTTTTTTP